MNWMRSDWPNWVKDLVGVVVVVAVALGVGCAVNTATAPSEEPVVEEHIVLEDESGTVQAVPSQDEILPVSLDQGGTPWKTVEAILEQQRAAGRAMPSLKDAVRKVCLDSGISVPVPGWDLPNGPGTTDHTKLPVGFELVINLTTLQAMANTPGQTGALS